MSGIAPNVRAGRGKSLKKSKGGAFHLREEIV